MLLDENGKPFIVLEAKSEDLGVDPAVIEKYGADEVLKNRILQQAGMAMMTQVNQNNEGALSILSM